MTLIFIISFCTFSAFYITSYASAYNALKDTQLFIIMDALRDALYLTICVGMQDTCNILSSERKPSVYTLQACISRKIWLGLASVIPCMSVFAFFLSGGTGF